MIRQTFSHSHAILSNEICACPFLWNHGIFWTMETDRGGGGGGGGGQVKFFKKLAVKSPEWHH